MTQCGKIQNLTKCTRFLLQADIHTDSHAFGYHMQTSLICILFPNLHKVQTYENRKNVTQ